MNLLLFYAEPMPFWQSMVTIGLMFIGAIVFMAIGGYIFVRIIAYVFNSYQGSWESSAKPLGLTVDKAAGGLYKPLVGNRNGSRISITHFSINPRTTSAGVVSVDHCALVEVMLPKPLDFSFKVSRRETLLEKAVGHVFDDSDEVGHEFFDRVFKAECSDMKSLRSLLNVELAGDSSPTVLTDLVHAAKKYHRVVLTDRSIALGDEAEFGQTRALEPIITRAIHLAGRVGSAASQSA